MAVSYIGQSTTLIATNGTAPGALTPHASTVNGDLLVFYHYSRATGGNETVAFPAGWNTVFNSVTANNGLVAVAWRNRTAGDTTYTATVTNHTTGTSGETILEWIETYRGHDPVNPIVNFTASLSTWASSTTLGSIAAPGTATVHNGDMVVVFAGRFENITSQTVLTGHSFTWATRVLNDTTQGLDAAAVTQNGLNASGSTQTVTAKSITTAGTAQAGAGRMFIIEQTIGPMAATSDGVATTTAELLAKGLLSTSISAEATTTAELLADGKLEGTADGVATTTATLTEFSGGAIEGSTAGSATTTATLIAKGLLVGSEAGLAVTTAVIVGRGSLTVSEAGTSTVTATLLSKGSLVAGATGLATTTAELLADGQLIGSTTSQAVTTAELNLIGVLTAEATGEAIVVGVIQAKANITGSCNGEAVVYGTMRVAGVISKASAHRLIGISINI
jgi:hypothetical protein